MRSVQLPSGERLPLDLTPPTAIRSGARPPAVVLAPGAGSDRRHPLLVSLARHIAAAGFLVVTFDFPYRAGGRRLPDRAPVLIAAWRAVLDAIARDPMLAPPWAVIGGRSMGGRMASLLLAEEDPPPLPVHGLLLLAYPLHPAGDPGRLRADHLPRISVPTLFIQGTRDALATPALLEHAISTMPKARLVSIPGADHSYRASKRTGTSPEASVLTGAVDWLTELETAQGQNRA